MNTTKVGTELENSDAELKELENLSRWDEALIGSFSSMDRGCFEDFLRQITGNGRHCAGLIYMCT